MIEPAKILEFPDAMKTATHDGVIAMTQRICTFYAENVDEKMLEGVKKIALASGITTAIVFDETAMKEVLRLGMEAYMSRDDVRENMEKEYPETGYDDEM